MKEDPESICDSKQCPICSQVLSLSEFGICRARKDGRNLYCKSCIRKKVTDSRRALREYKTARRRYVPEPLLETAEFPPLENELSSSSLFARVIDRMTPAERVREAIKKGARTQKEIAQETKLGKDEIGDALANLLLWTREIRTQVVDNIRIYYVNESSESPIPQQRSPNLPRRKRDVPGSFSALQGLMPGRNPEGDSEKLGGWVAA